MAEMHEEGRHKAGDAFIFEDSLGGSEVYVIRKEAK
jgi:hypothetical protein